MKYLIFNVIISNKFSTAFQILLEEYFEQVKELINEKMIYS